MTRMISRQEAAGLLNCHPQTISNWVEKGVIKGHKVGSFLMVDRNSIEQYFDSLKDLADMEQKIVDMKNELKERAEEMKATLNEACGFTLPSDRRREIFRENQMTLIKLFEGTLKDREREMLKRITMGQKLEDIAAFFGITTIRVLQIGAKAAAKISNVADIKQIVDENKNLKRENEQLTRQVADLSNRLEGYERNRIIKSSIFQQRIIDLHLSTRTVNALISLDCETIGDVVQLEKSYLMKARNFGKKSFDELDYYITEHGLHWGMRLDLMKADELSRYNIESEG